MRRPKLCNGIYDRIDEGGLAGGEEVPPTTTMFLHRSTASWLMETTSAVMEPESMYAARVKILDAFLRRENDGLGPTMGGNVLSKRETSKRNSSSTMGLCSLTVISRPLATSVAPAELKQQHS
ncbi:MAG: hypothetical protein LBS77_02085 [Desulfovibrio sp.]|nr:hypothetical protein [Desulfovibrio sp.]